MSELSGKSEEELARRSVRRDLPGYSVRREASAIPKAFVV